MNKTGNQVVLGVIVIVLIIAAWYTGRMQAANASMSSTATSTDSTSDTAATSGTTGAATTSTTPAAAGPTAVASGDSVSVADQSAGAEVAVKSVTLSQAGWVAVKDNNGRTLGAGWFPAGTQANVSVPLLRGTTAGEKYQALIYVDNGDKQFDLHTDTLLTNADGSVAGAMFTAN